MQDYKQSFASEVIEKTFVYSKDDYLKFQRFLEKDLSNKKSFLTNFIIDYVVIFIFIFIYFRYFSGSELFSWETALLVATFFILIYLKILLIALKYRNSFTPSDKGPFIGEHRFKFDDSSIYSEGVGFQASHSWLIVKRIEKTENAIYVFLDSASAFVFPLAQIDNPIQFYDYLNSKISTTELSG